MLRLRPSELTLTPEEVDDTFRRLAQRQASRASATVASRAAHRHGRPIIRRGPQRSPRDAITVLEDPFLLRLSPQHAVIASVEHGEDDDELLAPADNPHVQPSQATSAHPTPSLGLSSVQLPFRHPTDHAYVLQQTTRDQGEQPSMLSMVESPQHVLSTANSSPSRDSDSPFRPNTPAGAHSELRGGAGGEGSSRGLVRVGMKNTASTPSPLRREHTLKSSSHTGRSPDPVKASVTPVNDQPIRHLQGYFKSPFREPLGISYHFTELIQFPNSEPRPRTNRQPIPARSLSSGSVPALSSLHSRPEATVTSDEGVFETLARPSSRTQAVGPSKGFRPRQSSSEMSGASAAYSYYGSLPSGSRHSSSGQSASENLAHSQFDAATSPKELGTALHDRVQSSAYSSGSLLSPPVTSSSRPSPVPGQLGKMPLRPNPHEHGQSPQSTLRPPGFQQPGPISGFPDATEAAARDLRSPLDDYSEQYQRLNRDKLEQETLPSRMRAQQPHLVNNATSSRSVSGGGTNQDHHATKPAVPFEHDARGYPRPPPPTLTSRPNPSARVNPRSNGDLFASSPPTSNRSRGQVQTQRAAYELLQNASRAMQTMGLRAPRAASAASNMPPPPSPRDMRNRNRLHGPHQSMPRPIARREGDLMSSSPPPNPGLQHALRVPAPATRYGSPPVPFAPGFGPTPNFRDGPEGSRRTHRQVSTTATPSLHLQPSRDNPLTSLALDHGSGVTSRRSRSPIVRIPPIARTHRRVPASQRDQENSAEVEISAMQREEAAVNARYGDIGQQDTMDETPPRMGRVERSMFE